MLLYRQAMQKKILNKPQTLTKLADNFEQIKEASNIIKKLVKY